MLGTQALEGNALVRRVLVDEHQPVGSLADDISAENLPDKSQLREAGGTRRTVERRLRSGRAVYGRRRGRIVLRTGRRIAAVRAAVRGAARRRRSEAAAHQ